ncbi:MAG TPA: aminodeoxychorismate synthase component I [Pyrinomonadaceae bacterium]
MLGAKDTKAEVIKPIVYDIALTSDELLRSLFSLAPRRRLSILDSCKQQDTAARFLIAGFDPFEVIEARGRKLRIMRRGQRDEQTIVGDVLNMLDERLAQHHLSNHTSHDVPVAGACIATFAYELAHQLERLRVRSRGDSDEPDAVLAFYDTLVVHDYAQGVTKIASVGGEGRIRETTDALVEALRRDDDSASDEICVQKIASSFTREEYLAAVDKIKERIAAGDIYQANLTQAITCRLSPQSQPENIFLKLRRDHPTPFAAFVRRRDDVVVSASPERFLRVELKNNERYVEAWPIKGTRPRGATDESDERMRAELLTSEKDRAENVMIVDLLRNDLGRVCHYGSIKVTELCSLQELPTLFHLVSKVRGRLRDEVTIGDILRAAFPCGSITGAPKIRAIEIIDEIENTARGISMGAIGYFSFDGALDLSVAIRTMVVRDGLARFNVGGGIVADSSPLLEYDESLLKARSLLSALGVLKFTDLGRSS